MKLLALLCDADGCVERFEGTVGTDLVRALAVEEGWECSLRGDFCPRHRDRLHGGPIVPEWALH